MATALFLNEGDAIDYTPGSGVTAGDVVVQNELVGVVQNDIAANVKGSLRIKGVHRFPCATGSGTAIAAGKKVYWNASSTTMTETSGGATLSGMTVLGAADDDATVKVLLTPSLVA